MISGTRRGRTRAYFQKLGFALRRPDMAWQRLRGQPLLEISFDKIERALGGPPNVVLEAGCHDGADTAAMARAWPAARIHATEPLEQSRTAALRACTEFGGVSIDGFALSDVSGMASMRISSRDGNLGATASSSLLSDGLHSRAFPEVVFDRSMDVMCRTLDEWVENLEVSAIDLIWLDVQGMEHRVLAASPEALSVTRAIHVEVARVELFEGGQTWRELHALLTSNGFRLAIDRVGPVFGNALYIRR